MKHTILIAAILVLLYTVSATTLINPLDSIMLETEPSWEVIRGMAVGFVEGFNVDIYMAKKCLASPEGIWQDIEEYLSYLKEINWKNFNLVEIVLTTLETAITLAVRGWPCFIIYGFIPKYVDIIRNPTWKTIGRAWIRGLLINLPAMAVFTYSALYQMAYRQYYQAGKTFGAVIYMGTLNQQRLTGVQWFIVLHILINVYCFYCVMYQYYATSRSML
eukprot:TRINITY_DN136120_c0_g1_i1.p2 TRINITY_DN136120_c0_g1~~TRINITY_DN136120_c0_g1_i1.p2  ORF type:complete len:218 (-),score=1.39 TRINITY_DN136120_c0_g1_i1:120-773(-)